MSKFDKFRRGLRFVIALWVVMGLLFTGGFWLLIGEFTEQMKVATAVLVALSALYIVLGRKKPRRVSRQQLDRSDVPTNKPPMSYKGKFFDFTKFDPTAPDPSGDAWVGIPAS